MSKNSIIFCSLFSDKFQFLEIDRATRDEKELMDNLLSGNWVFIKSFTREYERLITPLGMALFKYCNINVSNLLVHETKSASLLIHNKPMTDEQKNLVYKLESIILNQVQ